MKGTKNQLFSFEFFVLKIERRRVCDRSPCYQEKSTDDGAYTVARNLRFYYQNLGAAVLD